MIFNIIDSKKFNESNDKIIFYNQKTSSCFAEIIHNDYTYKIDWNSSLLKPQIVELGSNIYSIGIDQNFAIIDFSSNQIILNLELSYFFYEVKIYKERIYICTELEILVLNNFSFETLRKIPLPDFYKEINFEDNFEIITCINGFVFKNNI
jgi:hypothetical protein